MFVKRRFLLLPLLALAAVASGCNDDNPTADDIAKYTSQALGIPVLLWAQPDDVCVNRQMTSFYKEYKNSKPDQLAKLVAKFKVYSAIVVQTSDDLGTLQANHYEMELEQRVCSNDNASNGYYNSDGGQTSCDTEQTKTDSLDAPVLSSSGKLPGTHFAKDSGDDGGAPRLYITPSFAKDSSVSRVVQTWDENFYNANIDNAAAIDAALANRSITLVSAKVADPMNCGPLLKLSDLL